VFAVLVTGVLVARSGSIVRCLGWPLYGSGSVLADAHDWWQMVRAIFAGGVSLLALAVQAWHTRRAYPPIPAVATAMAALFFVETIVGAIMAVRGLAEGLLLVYVPIMAAVYALLVVLAVLAGLPSPAAAARPEGAPQKAPATCPAR
jgi:heme A synthase